MPLVIILGIALRWLLRYAITKTMVILGVGYVAYSGINELREEIDFLVRYHAGGLPGDVYDFAMLCGLGEYITITLSAFTTYFIVKGLNKVTNMALRLNPLG